VQFIIAVFDILFAVSGYSAAGTQQRYGSEIVEEENEKMADVLADKVKALKSVSHISLFRTDLSRF